MTARLVQWTGSTAQQQALTRVAELSQAVDTARRNAVGIGASNPDLYRHLEQAHWPQNFTVARVRP